jgi:tRNA pseudouridine38-40 synthase
MAEGAALLEGVHDFSAFRASGCSASHPVRTVPRVALDRVGDEIHLVVEGTGFLRHMIRIVAGSLTEVGKGRRSPEWIGEVLESRDRGKAGRTAPPQGLTLEWIRYTTAWNDLTEPEQDVAIAKP